MVRRALQDLVDAFDDDNEIALDTALAYAQMALGVDPSLTKIREQCENTAFNVLTSKMIVDEVNILTATTYDPSEGDTTFIISRDDDVSDILTRLIREDDEGEDVAALATNPFRPPEDPRWEIN